MSTLSYDDQLKAVLIEIRDKVFDSETSFSEISRDDLANLINDCENQNFLAHRASKQQDLVISYMDGGFSIQPSTFITREGRSFIEGDENNSMPITNHFNFQNVYGANFGNNGSVTNNFSGISIDDLKSVIDAIPDKNDKEEGQQLVKTLETEEIKPGLLKRFDNLVGKYPNLVDLVGKIAMIQLFK